MIPQNFSRTDPRYRAVKLPLGYRGAVRDAFAQLPKSIQSALADVKFLVGEDPVQLGLHSWTHFPDGRRTNETMHYVPASNTIVIPTPETPSFIIHELGHALEDYMGYKTHAPQPCTPYAKTNNREAFAEAFTAWIGPEHYAQAAEYLYEHDRPTVEMFEAIAHKL